MDEDKRCASSRILIAEDEEPIAQALAFLVEDCGLTPVVATGGKHALELFRSHPPALIITDLMMPQMTGTQLITAIRAECATAGREPPPIILMSAAGKQYMVGASADALLMKPFNLTEVETLLARFLPDAECE